MWFHRPGMMEAGWVQACLWLFGGATKVPGGCCQGPPPLGSEGRSISAGVGAGLEQRLLDERESI